MKLQRFQNKNSESHEKDNITSVFLTKDTPESVVSRLGNECKQCNYCCSVDSGILFSEDITRIADAMQMPRDEFIRTFLDEHERFNTKCWKLKQLKEDNKPYGKCVLLGEKGCSVNKAKPKYCRLLSPSSKHGQQLAIWFALNYFVNPDDPESIRQWATYLKTHPTIPGGNLHELVPKQEQLQRILNYEDLK